MKKLICGSFFQAEQLWLISFPGIQLEKNQMCTNPRAEYRHTVNLTTE